MTTMIDETPIIDLPPKKNKKEILLSKKKIYRFEAVNFETPFDKSKVAKNALYCVPKSITIIQATNELFC